MSDPVSGVLETGTLPTPIKATAAGELLVAVRTIPGADAAKDLLRTSEASDEYETVAAGATAQVLGATGGVGDILGRLNVCVTTSGTATVTVTDGGLTGVVVVPAGAPVGAFTLTFGARSVNGAWKITTGAGVSVWATGVFT